MLFPKIWINLFEDFYILFLVIGTNLFLPTSSYILLCRWQTRQKAVCIYCKGHWNASAQLFCVWMRENGLFPSVSMLTVFSLASQIVTYSNLQLCDDNKYYYCLATKMVTEFLVGVEATTSVMLVRCCTSVRTPSFEHSHVWNDVMVVDWQLGNLFSCSCTGCRTTIMTDRKSVV